MSIETSAARPASTTTQPAQAGKPNPPALSGKPAVARVGEALRALIDLSGLSRREIEKRLSQQGGGVDLTRLLAGRFEIKLRHLLDIAQVIGIHPVELALLCFGEPRAPSPLLSRLEAVFAPGRLRPPPRPPAAPPAAGDLEALSRRVDELTQELAQLSAAATRPTESAGNDRPPARPLAPPPTSSR